jgi:hypothetical protein
MQFSQFLFCVMIRTFFGIYLWRKNEKRDKFHTQIFINFQFFQLKIKFYGFNFNPRVLSEIVSSKGRDFHGTCPRGRWASFNFEMIFCSRLSANVNIFHKFPEGPKIKKCCPPWKSISLAQRTMEVYTC